jgi:hypothetical protein
VTRTIKVACGILATWSLVGCGAEKTVSAHSPRASTRTTYVNIPVGTSTAAATGPTAPALDQLHAAERPASGQFPAAKGRTLRQMAELSRSTANLTPTTGTFTPGVDRYAFGLVSAGGGYVYGPTAIYVASSPNAPARGPFLAPADSMQVARPFRSAEDGGAEIKAVYDTSLRLPDPGVYALLSLTRGPKGWIAGSGELAAAASSPIPNVGSRPPAISTDTLASVHGKVSLLTTRTPPEDMHAVSFKDALGKRPIALLVSTPALCTSRVCGPVTDIMVELQHRYGGRIAFIHQEVFVDNDPARGLRPQLHAFHLETEPWLFTINKRGIITARLDGAFGVSEARRALDAALR